MYNKTYYKQLGHKMHIAFVSNTAWAMLNFRIDVLKELAQNNTITIIAPYDESIEKLKTYGFNHINIKINSKGTNPIEDMKLIIDLAKIYKQLNPDIIFHYTIKPNIYGTLASKIAGIKNNIAITTGLGYTFVNDNIISKISRALYKISFKYAKKVCFLNEDDLNIFLQHKLVNEKKCIVFPGEGVDISHFHPKNVTNSYQSDFLLSSRMLWDKGIQEYIDAIKILKPKYPHLKFALLGPCNSENPSAISQNQIIEWQNQGLVEYFGVTNDVRPYIKGTKCVVLPSSYREGMPACLLEGASMSKPLITTNNVGCREVVINGYNGFLCKIKDSNNLALVMENFINLTEEEQLLMGQNGRELVIKKFSKNKIIEIYKDIISQLN